MCFVVRVKWWWITFERILLCVLNDDELGLSALQNRWDKKVRTPKVAFPHYIIRRQECAVRHTCKFVLLLYNLLSVYDVNAFRKVFQLAQHACTAERVSGFCSCGSVRRGRVDARRAGNDHWTRYHFTIKSHVMLCSIERCARRLGDIATLQRKRCDVNDRPFQFLRPLR